MKKSKIIILSACAVMVSSLPIKNLDAAPACKEAVTPNSYDSFITN